MILDSSLVPLPVIKKLKTLTYVSLNKLAPQASAPFWKIPTKNGMSLTLLGTPFIILGWTSYPWLMWASWTANNAANIRDIVEPPIASRAYFEVCFLFKCSSGFLYLSVIYPAWNGSIELESSWESLACRVNEAFFCGVNQCNCVNAPALNSIGHLTFRIIYFHEFFVSDYDKWVSIFVWPDIDYWVDKYLMYSLV